MILYLLNKKKRKKKEKLKYNIQCRWAFQVALVVKNLPANTTDMRRRFNPWVRKIPWGVHSNPLQHSCLENPIDRGPWRATVHGTGKFSSVQSLSCVLPFATPWATAHQASLSITNSRSPAKPMSIESVMPSNHIILCRPLFLLTPIPPSIRVFSNESTLHNRWSKFWSFSFSISPSNEPRTDLL